MIESYSSHLNQFGHENELVVIGHWKLRLVESHNHKRIACKDSIQNLLPPDHLIKNGDCCKGSNPDLRRTGFGGFPPLELNEENSPSMESQSIILDKITISSFGFS